MLSKNQIKELQSLQLKKFRDQHRLFIAEGVKTVSEILKHRASSIKELLATTDFIDNHRQKINEYSITVNEISEIELKKISLQNSPNKAMAVCNYFDEGEGAFDFKNNFSVYLDDLRDPGNLGTIIRLAGWFGIDTIFCSANSCDFYNPKVIQSTMAAFLRVKVRYISLQELIRQQNIKHIYGAVLNGENIYKTEIKNGLIVIGNEANGISEENLKLISNPVTIPASKENETESLNAAMAASILVSEFFRQLKVMT